MNAGNDMVHALAALAMRARTSSLDELILDKVKLHAFDSFGAIFAGAQTAEGIALRGPFMRMATARRSSGLGGPACAAAILSASCRLTECDDIHLTSCTTPGSVVCATALAMTEITEVAGNAAAEAVAAGYEVMAALGITANGPEIVYGGNWPTYLAAAITSAVVAAKLMNLSEDRIATAIAIAATMTTGTTGRIAQEPSSRWLTLGCAVHNGMAAAAGAEAGLYGDSMVLEHLKQTFAAARFADALSSSVPAIVQTAFKPYCTGRQSLAATEAFISLCSDETIEPASIERIRVIVPPQYRAMIDRPSRPKNKVESRGVRYQLAIAALYPDDLFDLDRRHLRTDDPEICRITDMIEVEGSTSLGKMYPRAWPGAVAIQCGGKTFERSVVHPNGDPERPLTWGDIDLKLRSIAKHCRDPLRVSDLAAAAQQLDFGRAMALFSAPQQP